MSYILIGKIINSFGIKGEVKVHSFSDFEEDRYKKDSFVYLGEDHLKLTVESYRHHKGFTLLKFKEYDNINQILDYVNLNIYKDSSDTKELTDGRYFIRELIDFDVYQDNIKIGKCIDFEEGVKYNFMRIKKLDNKEVLVPFLKAFVLSVDKDQKIININNIEGLV